MAGRFRGIFLDNLLLKLVSIALSVLLFVLVRAERQSLAHGTIKVAFIPPPGLTLVDPPPTTLRIGVAGPASRIQRFRFEDLASVTLDLSGVEKGQFKFRDSLVSLPSGLRVSSINPPSFLIRYEPVIVRRVPVEVTLSGQVAPGFQVLRRVAHPTHVDVRGPQSAVNAVRAVLTQSVGIEGAQTTTVAQVALQLPSSDRKLTTPLTVQPHRVEVLLQIAPLLPEATLSAITVSVEDAAGRRTEVDPRQVDVTVAGAPQLLAHITKTDIVARVYVQRQQQGRLRLKPTIEGLPSGVTVRRVQPARVQVTVNGR